MAKCLSIWILLGWMIIGHACAQLLNQPKEYRVLLLLNGGHSMSENWNGYETKYQLSSGIIVALMDSMYTINDQVAFGLNVYGHLYPQTLNRCNDNRNEVAFNKDNRAQVNLRVLDIKPKGIASLTLATKAAINDLTDTSHYYYSILIITDSSDRCNDDICGTTKDLLKEKVNFKTYVITIGNKEVSKKYSCLGESLPIATNEDIIPTIQYIVGNYRKFLPAQKNDVISLRKSKPAEDWNRTTHAIAIKDSVIKKNIASQDSVRTVVSNPVQIEQPVIIRKNSNITAEEEINNYGYLQLKDNYSGSLAIYHNQNGKYFPIDNASTIVRTAGYKIKLKEGQYKVVYGNHEKTFRIVKNMITDIWLN